MIQPKRAAEVVALLTGIHYELGRYYEGEDTDAVMAKLVEKVGELRDALWHEVPLNLARIMDEEEGLERGRGT